MPRGQTLKERFEEKIDYKGNCFEWIGNKNDNGYGRLWCDGKMKKATHVAWFLSYDNWPKQINHKCNNTLCVRVSHLYNGTLKENSIDRSMIGRQRSQKLMPYDVLNIKSRITLGHKMTDIAKDYNVSRYTIVDIKRGRNWSHLINLHSYIIDNNDSL